MAGEEFEHRAEPDRMEGVDGGFEGRPGRGGPGAELDEDGLAGRDMGGDHRGGREVTSVGAIEERESGKDGQEGVG
jgi:hypothetical protein